VQLLQPYDLLKGEILMLLNLRPSSRAHLDPIIEENSIRFTETQLDEIVAIVSNYGFNEDGTWDETRLPSAEAAPKPTKRAPVQPRTAADSFSTSTASNFKAPKGLRERMAVLARGKIVPDIDDNIRESLIAEWENTKARRDWESVKEWDARMAGFLEDLYGSEFKEPRLVQGPGESEASWARRVRDAAKREQMSADIYGDQPPDGWVEELMSGAPTAS